MKISEILTIKHLAYYLYCEEDFLHSFFGGNIIIVDFRGETSVASRNKYSSFVEVLYIPKKNRRLGYREVYRPLSDNLTNTLKIFNGKLKELYEPGPAAHGFVAGRNIGTNATHHLAKQHVLSLDLYKFFETIPASFIETGLKKLGFPSFASDHLSKLVTLFGKLPQGYTTSPLLANLVAEDLDEALTNFVGENVSYTRYADDLYFSSNKEVPDWRKLEEIIEAHGFSINPKKTKLMKRGGWQFVTGLTVFDNEKPRIPKKLKRNLRLEIYYLKKFGYRKQILRKLNYTEADYETSFAVKMEVREERIKWMYRIDGWLNHFHAIEKTVAQRLREGFDSIGN